MEITKKEILVSIIILFVMLTIGFFIGEKIQSRADEWNQRYEEAVKINKDEMFKYALRTAAGDAFIEGDYKGVDYVSADAIDGKYLYILRKMQRYTMHTRVVNHSDGKRSWTTTETYWTWDTIGEEEVHCAEIEYAGVRFPWGKVDLPEPRYITTVSDGCDLRSEYYTIGDTHGTMFAKIKKNDIEETEYKENVEIKDAVNRFKKNGWIVIFWIIWIVLTGGLIWILYYNDWID